MNKYAISDCSNSAPSPLTAKTDEPRFRRLFASPNGKFELRYKSEQFSQQSRSLIEKATGAVRYQAIGELGSRTVLVSTALVKDWNLQVCRYT
jgi:hypothetical protein